MNKNFLIMGPPGAGKGTQSNFLCNHFGFEYISTGDAIRAAIQSQTEFGEKAKKLIDAGNFVSDQDVLNIIQERIKIVSVKTPILFDGFPRNLAQAKRLDIIFDFQQRSLDGVILLEIEDRDLITRLSKRWVSSVGRTYHLEFNPPKKKGICDIDGTELFQREDDKPQIIKHRLEVYRKQTLPAVEFYKNKKIVYKIDATQNHHDISQQIVQIVDQCQSVR